MKNKKWFTHGSRGSGQTLWKMIYAFENKLAKLEKENVELKENIKTAYRKGMRHMAKALKDYDRTDGAWTDYFEHTVDKVLQKEQVGFEDYGTLTDQLIKAKEIIRGLYFVIQGRIDYKGNIPLEDEMYRAEQFLSEVKGWLKKNLRKE